MKKWIAIIAALALAVVATAAIVVAVGGGGDADDPCDPLPLRSDCGIDPDECNEVHNIDACDDGELGLPANDEEPVRSGEGSDSGGGTTLDDPCDPLPLRSDCDIDPDVCNVIHNITACSEEELERGFPNTP